MKGNLPMRDPTTALNTTLGDALDRYQREISVRKKGARQEASRIRAWKKSELANKTLARLETADFEAYSNEFIEATLVNAGNPTVFVAADALGLTARELQPQVNGDAALLERCERIRAHAAVRMGLAASADAATRDRPATPKLSFVAPPSPYTSSAGKAIEGERIDLLARILSMGALHHAYTGTGAVALAVAAALPGSVVARASRNGASSQVRIGHTSGTLTVGAEVKRSGDRWEVTRALMSRSARRLMSGWVHLPNR